MEILVGKTEIKHSNREYLNFKLDSTQTIMQGRQNYSPGARPRPIDQFILFAIQSFVRILK